MTASHAEITEGLKAPSGPGLAAARRESLASQRLKERALKEVTNKLEARPVKLKPSWAGPKGNGTGVREVGPATGWSKKGDPIRSSEQGLWAQLEDLLEKGVAAGRPPDPTQIGHQNENLATSGPNSASQQNHSPREEGSGEEVENGFDETMLEATTEVREAAQAAKPNGGQC